MITYLASAGPGEPAVCALVLVCLAQGTCSWHCFGVGAYGEHTSIITTAQQTGSTQCSSMHPEWKKKERKKKEREIFSLVKTFDHFLP